MTYINKEKLVKDLDLCEAGCHACKYADKHEECTRMFDFPLACETIFETSELTEEDIVFNYCTKHAINEIKIKNKEFKLVEHGTWKPVYFDSANRRSVYECSVCGAHYPRSNYCPTCGSKMTVERTGENK